MSRFSKPISDLCGQNKFQHRGLRYDSGTRRDILSASVAAALPIKPSHRFDRADLKRLAKHVARVSRRPPPSVLSSLSIVVPSLGAENRMLGFESVAKNSAPGFLPHFISDAGF